MTRSTPSARARRPDTLGCASGSRPNKNSKKKKKKQPKCRTASFNSIYNSSDSCANKPNFNNSKHYSKLRYRVACKVVNLPYFWGKARVLECRFSRPTTGSAHGAGMPQPRPPPPALQPSPLRNLGIRCQHAHPIPSLGRFRSAPIPPSPVLHLHHRTILTSHLSIWHPNWPWQPKTCSAHHLHHHPWIRCSWVGLHHAWVHLHLGLVPHWIWVLVQPLGRVQWTLQWAMTTPWAAHAC